MTTNLDIVPLALRGEDPIADGLLRAMQTIRAVETVLRDASLQGRFEGPLHVSLGQESVAVGVMAALEPADPVLSNHRGHGHALAYGLDPERVIAEIVGAPGGPARGGGGSMHIFATSEGFMGTNGVVGDPAGIGLGIALASTVRQERSVTVVFIGDGAMGTGIVYEAMNIAALWRLPYVLVCENNGYAEMTPTSVHLSSPPNERARAFGLAAEVVDGIDVEHVRAAAERAVAAARSRHAAFLEVRTHRWTGHYVGDPREYRPPEEEAEWRRAHDPIRSLARRMQIDDNALRASQLALEHAATELLDRVIRGRTREA